MEEENGPTMDVLPFFAYEKWWLAIAMWKITIGYMGKSSNFQQGMWLITRGKPLGIQQIESWQVQPATWDENNNIPDENVILC